MEKSTINKRFIEAVDYLLSTGKVDSKGALAATLGIKSTKFSEILNERMNIGTDLAALICSHYDISPEWLLLGIGSKFRNDQLYPTEPVMVESEKSGEAAAFYKMYKEKDEENKELLKENARLEERLRLAETGKSDFGQAAESASSENTLSRTSRSVTSAGAHLKG